mgnify:CR=1 FL=1
MESMEPSKIAAVVIGATIIVAGILTGGPLVVIAFVSFLFLSPKLPMIVRLAACIIHMISGFLDLPIGLAGLITMLTSFYLLSSYKPKRVSPRKLIDQNLILSVPIVMYILWTTLYSIGLVDSMHKYRDEKVVFGLIFIIAMGIMLYFFHNSSKKAYDRLIANQADDERNWTNNVLSLLSHNIRTPIATMGNRVEIIKFKHERDKEITQDDIESLDNARESLNSIVHGLLSKSSRNLIT